MLESPKKRFLLTPYAKRLRDIMTDPAVIAGLDAALLQMIWEAGASKTTETAAAGHWQMTGAYRLRDLLLTISTQEKSFPHLKSDNLPHEI